MGGEHMDKLLNATELSKKLGVHRNTVVNWKKKGMPHVTINGRDYFTSSDVTNWINNDEENKVVSG